MGPAQSGSPEADHAVLTIKVPQNGAILSSYWPITNLCTTKEILSSIRMTNISRQMTQYMSETLKKIKSNSREAEHQLLVTSPSL